MADLCLILVPGCGCVLKVYSTWAVCWLSER